MAGRHARTQATGGDGQGGQEARPARHAAQAQPQTAAQAQAQSQPAARGAAGMRPAVDPQAGGHAAAEVRQRKAQRKRARRGGRGRSVLSTILLLVGIALIVVAVGLWGYAQMRYHKQAETNEELAAYVQVPDDPNQPPVVDWAGLKAINPEVVGWVQVPGTAIDYPVYQASDNEKYLRHNARGEYTIGGQIFLDCDNTAPGLVDQQSILYGHHLKDGSMFYALYLLKDQETFDATTTVWYVTEGATYELEPLFDYFTQPDDADVRQFQFADEEEFHSYLRGRLQKAVAQRPDAEQIIDGTQHVLTMSTCNYIEGYGRSELVCVPKDEAAAATGASASGGTEGSATTEATADATTAS